MHCYWDLLPLEAPALVCSYLLPWRGWEKLAWSKIWKRMRVPLLTCVVLVNFEWVRAVRGILYNLHAIAGNPVAWTAWDFLAHALGLKSSIWERSYWFTRDVPLHLLGLGCAAAMVFLGVIVGSRRAQAPWRYSRRRLLGVSARRWRWEALAPTFVWLGICLLLFGFFRWVVPSPWQGQSKGAWPDGMGQSWNQYKVTNWASLAVISVATTFLVGWSMRWRPAWAQWGMIVILVAWSGVGLGWDVHLARRRGTPLVLDTGIRREPLTACVAIQQRLATLPKSDWIYLDWPTDGRGNKLRQLMVYLLSDHPLASNWATDEALLEYVTPEDAKRTIADCHWVLRYRPPVAGQSGSNSSIGRMTLELDAIP